MSVSCTAQQLTKENATHWAEGKITNDIRQCIFFHLLSLPKEKYLYIVYKVVCLCYIPSKQCFEEMRFFKEVQLNCTPYKASFNQTSCCHLQAGGCFWANVFSGKTYFCDGWIFLFNKNMCYLRCVLCSKVQYSCLLPLSFIMITFLQADVVFFKDWILHLRLQSYLAEIILCQNMQCVL